MFSQEDLMQFESKGIDKGQVERQIEKFKSGFPHARLLAPASIGNGILKFNDKVVDRYVEFFEQNSDEIVLLKFVPASGAASRMFKHLFEFRAALESDDAARLLSDPKYKLTAEFFENLNQFAFYPVLEQLLRDCVAPIDELISAGRHAVILDYFLGEKGMNYASLPKALLLFHSYPDANRVALEEHLVEGAMYSRSGDEVHIHFTVSPEHEKLFENYIKKVLPKYMKRFRADYFITFSEQKSSTDTVAVDMDNKPFRNKDGSILFRPGGHGALIENLNDLEADIIFIKNIDNVVPDALREPTYRYKKLLGGYLLEMQSKTFQYLEKLESGEYDDRFIDEVFMFATNDLMIRFGDEFPLQSKEEKAASLFEKMNRPIRVCGMVKNQGEPGGGPFWVQNSKGESLQIVESSQIDMNDPEQKKIFESSTHFNPVDLVCGVKNYKSQAFNLLDYVDNETGFISQKSKDGRDLKALELPGLWNGAMADWISVFVEVPIETFNPVKTINDLLRPEHRA